MPFERDRSPYYYIWKRTLPGYGDSGRISTKVTSKKVARDMERLLEEIAQKALVDPTWKDLLDAVCKAHSIDLPTLLQAKCNGELRAMKRRLNDPLFAASIEDFRKTYSGARQTFIGLEMLDTYAGRVIGPKARLGDLTARTITDMCRAAETGPEASGGDGRKRNSVRRTLLRAISLLLRYHLGNAERDRIFADVRFTSEDDTRDVNLLPSEIAGLISACYELG